MKLKCRVGTLSVGHTLPGKQHAFAQFHMKSGRLATRHDVFCSLIRSASSGLSPTAGPLSPRLMRIATILISLVEPAGAADTLGAVLGYNCRTRRREVSRRDRPHSCRFPEQKCNTRADAHLCELYLENIALGENNVPNLDTVALLTTTRVDRPRYHPSARASALFPPDCLSQNGTVAVHDTRFQEFGEDVDDAEPHSPMGLAFPMTSSSTEPPSILTMFYRPAALSCRMRAPRPRVPGPAAVEQTISGRRRA